jgi:arsenite methyltransferase
MTDNITSACCSGLYELPITSILLGDSFHPGGPALTRTLAEASLVSRESRVLDVACGKGVSAKVIAEGFGATVFGIDYSVQNMTAPSVGSGESVQFAGGASDRLPFRDETFDVVICECALCTFADKGTALKEMRRVLKPGGRLGLSDMVINRPIPHQLAGVFGQALCIAGALTHAGYIETLKNQEFAGIRSRDVSDKLLEMLASIEKRIDLAIRLSEAGELELPDGFDDPGTILQIARDFVVDGGLGYSLITAKKKRGPKQVSV